MTEKIRKRLLDLKAAQDANTPMNCPRCGADAMKLPMATNALSRVADLYICDSCGNTEGLLAFMRHSHPLHRWSVFEPQKPDSDFKARPAKDVLDVLRPVLACKWILHRHTKPPMLFRELMDSELEESLKPVVERLLDIKMNAPEIKEIPKVEEINRYLDETINTVRQDIFAYPGEHRPDWAPLNQLFLQTLLNATTPISDGA